MDCTVSQHSVICQWGHWDTTPFSMPLGPGIQLQSHVHCHPSFGPKSRDNMQGNSEGRPLCLLPAIAIIAHCDWGQYANSSGTNKLVLYTPPDCPKQSTQYPFCCFSLEFNWWSFECIQNSPLPPDAIPLAGNALICQTDVSCLPWVRALHPIPWDFFQAHLSPPNQGAILCPFCWCVLCWEILRLWRKWSLPHCLMRYDGLFCYGNQPSC